MKRTVQIVLVFATLALAGCPIVIDTFPITSLSEARSCFEDDDGPLEDDLWDTLVAQYRSMRETDWTTKEDAYYFLTGICESSACTTCFRKLVDAVW